MTSSSVISKPSSSDVIPPEQVDAWIFLVRGRKVFSDKHLAELHGTTTRLVNQAVSRMFAEHVDLSRVLTSIEKKYDARFRAVFAAFRELMTPLEEVDDADEIREIGFHTALTTSGKS